MAQPASGGSRLQPSHHESRGWRPSCGAAYNPFTSAYSGPGFAAAVAMQTELYRRLLPWTGGRSLYNFTSRPDGRPADAAAAFDEPGLVRLQAVKAARDPENLFRFALAVPPSPTDDHRRAA